MPATGIHNVIYMQEGSPSRHIPDADPAPFLENGSNTFGHPSSETDREIGAALPGLINEKDDSVVGK